MTEPGTCPRCERPAAYGLEYQGLYDGVLIWVCDAGHQWPRFPPGTSLSEIGMRSYCESADD